MCKTIEYQDHDTTFRDGDRVKTKTTQVKTKSKPEPGYNTLLYTHQQGLKI